MINFLKLAYKQTPTLDLAILTSKFPTEPQKAEFLDFYAETIDTLFSQSEFLNYQETLLENYRNNQFDNIIKRYEAKEITREEMLSQISNVNNENLYLQDKNSKKTPEEILQIIRNVDNQLMFSRLSSFNTKVFIKQNTINIIGARPSEGKSALALNLFCDLSKKYRCLYFNMEMTEPEVYERIIGIEGNLQIKDIKKPQTEYQEKIIKETLQNMFANSQYEIVNGSKHISSLRSKIIREQTKGHLVVFIDYIGYVTSRYGLSDKDRIGEITRELNNLTKDYNCTIFILAQINRGGVDIPSMNDLKDSGELEQSADTIILIHDKDKQSQEDIKYIDLLIPKCRSSKRNVGLKIKYDKTKQRMECVEDKTY